MTEVPAARILMHRAGRTEPLVLGAHPAPALSSRSTTWAGVPFEVHRVTASEPMGEVGPVDGECGVLAILGGSVRYTYREARRDVTYEGGPGCVTRLSGDARRFLVRGVGHAEAIAVNLPGEWFERVHVDGVPARFGAGAPLENDSTAYHLVHAMYDEVRRGASAGRLFAESVSLALLAHLAEHSEGARSFVRGHLSEVHAHRLRRHVRERLQEDLGLVELAEVVGLRPRHFTTLFRRAFGVTPHQFVIRERLREGARLLVAGSHGVAEVALRVGFANQSHFSTAFRRAFGVSPRRYSRERRALSPCLVT